MNKIKGEQRLYYFKCIKENNLRQQDVVQNSDATSLSL